MIPLTKNVADPLVEWKRMVEERQDLVTDPDGQRVKLRELAMLAYQRYQVDADELSDMLEITEAAREWGLLELEEGFRLGMFDSPEFGLQAGTQYFDGKKMVRAG
ncbi:hypothetical protein [Pseudomonas lutea]|uniref:hypothetical protein n=1 Tax=Pseudomonas lutea TaxID=243924 RepID=UPI00068E4FC6|nr:hypothetical protein [Pseudomonas lutea]